MNNPRLLVGGEWLETAAWLPVRDAFTGAEIARVPLGDERTLDDAVAAAHDAFPRVRTRPAHEHAAILARVVLGLEKRRAQFAETIVAEAGKPIVAAETEVARAIGTFTWAAEEARRAHGGEVLPLDGLAAGEGHIGLVRRFPIGVIAGITPFNFPLNLVAHKVAPALATGNCLVLKPAPKCPLTALLLAEVLVEAGVPAGQMNVVTCANEHVARLVTDERVAMVSFTGSPAVGWPLKTMAGKKKVVLELGGNAAVIVEPDADLATAIPAIATGGFIYAGQTCISVQRIFVHQRIYEPFRQALAAHIAEKIKAGDPRDRATVVGPMISREALDKTLARLDSALRAGAKLLCGGAASGPCLTATVLEDAPDDHEICAEELFAPIVTLHRYAEADEALTRVNASRYGLQTGIFTRDLRLALRAFEQLEVGAVLINQIPTWRADMMPYGGLKDSGFGREGIRPAMEEMTEPKVLVLRQ